MLAIVKANSLKELFDRALNCHELSMLANLRTHGFTLWLILAVALAIWIPELAADGGLLRSEVTTLLGVMVIFFLQGLSLPTEELTLGYMPKRLHVFVLLWNFLLFPVLTVGLLRLVGSGLSEEFHLAFGLLAIMPTTVASAIAFTSLAGGATSNAIFSTIYSNVAAVWLVPAVCVAYLASSLDVVVPLFPLLAKLVCLILAPLVFGQVIHRMFPAKAALIGGRSKWVSQLIIVYIVHAAFANGVQSGVLQTVSVGDLWRIGCLCFALLVLVSTLVWGSSSVIRLRRPERIAAFFCASQKSLATGLPLATSILAATGGVLESSLLILPLMIYHPLQLMCAGVLCGWLNRGRAKE